MGSDPVSQVRVLYLAGSGRSGSTLVTTVLGQLPGFFAAGELRYLWRRGLLENRPCGCGSPLADCPVWAPVRADLADADPAGIATRLAERLRVRGCPHCCAVSVGDSRRCQATRRHAPGPALRLDRRTRPSRPGRRGHRRLLQAAAVRCPARRPARHRPVRPARGARPRATAYSWRRRRSLDGNADDQLMSRPPVGKAALLWLVWNTATVRLWGGRDDGRYLRVRYEDFVADPSGTTARIARFVGASPTSCRSRHRTRCGWHHPLGGRQSLAAPHRPGRRGRRQRVADRALHPRVRRGDRADRGGPGPVRLPAAPPVTRHPVRSGPGRLPSPATRQEG
ncbi:hypothetical protein NKG94_14870 [Micromonospora sp. M12]